LVADGDTQRRFYSGCPRAADGQIQIHAGNVEEEFRRDDPEQAGEKVIRELGMRNFTTSREI
jgi:hypothetical protein